MKNKILVIGSFILICAFLPLTAKADTTAQTQDSVSLPISSGAKTNLQVVVTNDNRLLGDVQFTIDNVQFKTPDPPPVAGYTVKNFTSGSHHLVAQRRGYEVIDKQITVESGVTYQKLSVNLVPLLGTPVINVSNVQALINSYNSLNSNNSVINAYNTNGLTGTNQTGVLNNSGLIGTNTQNSFPYSQINYNNFNQTYQVPIKITVVGTGVNPNGSELTQVQIVDQTSNNVELSNIFTETNAFSATTPNLYRYGCLQAGRQYTLVVKSLSSTSVAPSYFTFVTNQQGTYVDAKISIAAFYNQTNVPGTTNNLVGINSLSTSSLTGNVQCPSAQNGLTNNTLGNTGLINNQVNNGLNTGIQTSGAYSGPQVWSGGQINLSGYQVVLAPLNGNYYLVNSSSQLDTRQITFIDRGDGKGGLAFIPAQSALQGNNMSAGTTYNWYVSTYTRDTTSGSVQLGSSTLSPSTISPDQYASALNKQIVSNFAKTSTTAGAQASATAAASSGTSDLSKNCVKNQDQTFCLSGEAVSQSYKNGTLDKRINLIASEINSNKNSTKDQKGSPFLNIIISNDDFDKLDGSSTVAATCFVNLDNSGKQAFDNSCLGLVKNTLGDESYSNLQKSGIKEMAITIYREKARENSRDIDDSFFEATIDHEWAHIYDYQSTFKGTQTSISTNSDYAFAKFTEANASQAKTLAESNNIVGKDKERTVAFDSVTQQYPLCVYYGLEISPLLKSQTTSGQLKTAFLGNTYANPSELFAYTYGVKKSKLQSKIIDLMIDSTADTKCFNQFQTLIEEHNKFFN